MLNEDGARPVPPPLSVLKSFIKIECLNQNGNTCSMMLFLYFVECSLGLKHSTPTLSFKHLTADQDSPQTCKPSHTYN